MELNKARSPASVEAVTSRNLRPVTASGRSPPRRTSAKTRSTGQFGTLSLVARQPTCRPTHDDAAGDAAGDLLDLEGRLRADLHRAAGALGGGTAAAGRRRS